MTLISPIPEAETPAASAAQPPLVYAVPPALCRLSDDVNGTSRIDLINTVYIAYCGCGDARPRHARAPVALHRLLGLILPRALLVGFQLLLQLLTLLLGLLLLLLLKTGFLLLSAIVHMILQLLLRPVGGDSPPAAAVLSPPAPAVRAIEAVLPNPASPGIFS